ncbi:MAG: ABC transporter permease [Alphaproteobacteria bacterium]|nr:ABC transporter permease [Alphaproteobacteria bacterium]
MAAKILTFAARQPRAERRRETLFRQVVRRAPQATLFLFLAPLAAGLLATAAPALGWLPALGGRELSAGPLVRLLAHPDLAGAVAVSVVSGGVAALVSLFLALAFAASFHHTRAWRLALRLTPSLIALPHAALAVGLAFLVAPSGPVFRLSRFLFGAPELPPLIVTLQDKYGLALALGLVVKEFPFLLLILISASHRLHLQDRLHAARCLGYSPATAWFKVALPELWPQMRLPFFAVIAYSLSVVDMAIILGPNNPPSLAVLVLRLFYDPDLSLRFPAACGAVLQLLIAAAAIVFCLGGEKVVAAGGRLWCQNAKRGRDRAAARGAVLVASATPLVLGAGALFALLVWSFADSWRWPDLIPPALGLKTWNTLGGSLVPVIFNSAALALASAALAVALSLLCLENERLYRVVPAQAWLLYLPLLLPQISILFGILVCASLLRLDETFTGVVWTHFVFVFPYVFLLLAAPHRQLDERFSDMAASLGHGQFESFLRVRLALLARAVAVAFAVGFAVSIAQYLPTLLLAPATWNTLTMEAVAASHSATRREVAVWAFLQAFLPLIVFTLAIALPGPQRMRRGARRRR